MSDIPPWRKRRSPGKVVADISRDLGLVVAFILGAFALFGLMLVVAAFFSMLGLAIFGALLLVGGLTYWAYRVLGREFRQSR
jgi:positive regulator of sigma E activity